MTYFPAPIGYPRIGDRRQLKWLLEERWRGDVPDFHKQVEALRRVHLDEQVSLIGAAVDDFFLYDQVLETAMALGYVPAWAQADDDFDALTALARGTVDNEAWEMTKWFDTNYHYVVPELDGAATGFEPPWWRQPLNGNYWAVAGPYTLVKLSKVRGDLEETAASVGAALFDWVRAHPEVPVQLDEPALGLVLTDGDRRLLEAAYAGADALPGRPRITVQFGIPDEAAVAELGRRGFSVQLRLADVTRLQGSEAWTNQPEYLISVLDGRSVWPDDFDVARAVLAGAAAGSKLVHLTTTTSLMFLPVTVEGEDLPGGFRFAREKGADLAEWCSALTAGTRPETPALTIPEFPIVGDLAERVPRPERRAAQDDLNLPAFPTTTTGSLPQTSEVRKVRAAYKKGSIPEAEYLAAVDAMIGDAIRWQQQAGLDVLVHGEFERSDMVEYFGERMDGFLTTDNGWVLSYGSRCVRPPIIAAPPTISAPMTVREWKVAQAAATKPVKGMLTGPVTIVNWSFRPPGVGDDRLFWAVAQPIAAEVVHLVEAGARIIQIDEPAVRERWPLPTLDAEEHRKVYARGVRAALNRVFNAPAPVQMHTHMCYGDFGDIVPLWSDAGVDVASIEYSRSKDDGYIHQFYDLFRDGHLQIGPGVFDVHSPHSPGAETMAERLRHFREFMDSTDLWVNPDCGLKTRTWDDLESQLGDLVAAARTQRESG